MKKKIAWLSIFVISIHFIGLGIYALQFKNTGLSHETSDWGAFGAYYGGILTPLISISSLVILLFMLHYTQEQLRENRNFLSQERFENGFFKELEALDSFISREGVRDHKEYLKSLISSGAKEFSLKSSIFDGSLEISLGKQQSCEATILAFLKRIGSLIRAIRGFSDSKEIRSRYCKILGTVLGPVELLALLAYMALEKGEYPPYLESEDIKTVYDAGILTELKVSFTDLSPRLEELLKTDS
jgi:uncharacterized membrane protein